jgi:hypothetical protein
MVDERRWNEKAAEMAADLEKDRAATMLADGQDAGKAWAKNAQLDEVSRLRQSVGVGLSACLHRIIGVRLELADDESYARGFVQGATR